MPVLGLGVPLVENRPPPDQRRAFFCAAIGGSDTGLRFPPQTSYANGLRLQPDDHSSLPWLCGNAIAIAIRGLIDEAKAIEFLEEIKPVSLFYIPDDIFRQLLEQSKTHETELAAVSHGLEIRLCVFETDEQSRAYIKRKHFSHEAMEMLDEAIAHYPFRQSMN